LIELVVPVEQIPYIRTIEGRKFKDGKWIFPDHALPTLQKYGLVAQDLKIEKPPKIEYKLSPFLRGYQKDIVNDALNAGCYGIFADTGVGKTVISLEIASHFKKTLVLCPLSVIETAWIDDCKKFYPQMKIINCWSNTSDGRFDLLDEEADVYVMNYESYKIVRNKIMKSNFDCMIVDESSCMKNMKSQITSMILEMVNVIPHRFVLSGCPCPNHNSEIFPQMKFVNNEIFGNNYYGFLARYFHQDLSNPHVWFQTAEDKERYNLRLTEQSVFLKKEDCVDLPEKVFQVRRFEMASEQKQHYNELLNDIKSHINEWSKFEFTAKLMKLREITSGFVYTKDSNVITMDSNKPKALAEILEEIGNKQVIIWCQFQHEIKSLAEQFGGVALTSSSSKTKERYEIIRDFRDGKIQYLFTHPSLMGKGLTFVNCTYNVYYSLSFSYEEFKQSQDRIHRIGQTNKCTYIIMQAKDTIDEKIYSCLQRKESAVDELYNEIGLKVNNEN
jgi:SNF2 family DNA or RNA helicase